MRISEPNLLIVKSAVTAFLLSRGIILAVLILLSQIAFLQKIYSGSVWETRIDLDQARLQPGLTQQVLIGDAWWYRAIASDGYHDSQYWGAREKAAFFPLYPLLVRMLRVTGDFALDGVLLSNFALLLGLVVVGMIASNAGLTTEDAQRAIFYAAFFPTSYFYSLPMTESLFLLLSGAAYLAASNERWWIAGIMGGLAALTRVNGVLLAPVLLIVGWQTTRRVRPQLLWLLLIPTGTGLYMLHLYRLLGDPLAFVGAQQAWGRAPDIAVWRPLLRYLSRPDLISESWNFLALNFAIALLLLSVGISFLIRGSAGLGAYTLLSVLIPLSSGSTQSLGRYALVVFPLFLWLATIGRSTLIDRLIMLTSASIFGCMLVLFALRVDFALA